jgi:peptide deformylase
LSEAEANQPKKLVLINPEVIERSGTWTMEEGCLSIPDVRGDVERPETIRVRFQNANFEEVEVQATGMLGRVILHEIDHLDGVLFIDYLSSAKRALLRGKLKNIKKGEVETSYPVVTAPAPRRSGRVEV